MKDHAKTEAQVDSYDRDLDDLIAELQGYGTWMKSATASIEWGYLVVEGWRPMTDAEKGAAEKRSARVKETYAKRKVNQEAKALAKLEADAAKLGLKVTK